MRSIAILLSLLLMLSCAEGCKTCQSSKGAHLPQHLPSPPPDMPRELSKVVLPAYTIEPPDILVVSCLAHYAGHILRL